MSSTTSDLQVRTYLTALETYLDDLPDDDRRELLEDVELHVAEVAAENDGTLVERLGTPEAYGAELRASAGLPARTDVPRAGLVTRVRTRAGRSTVGRSLRAIADIPFVWSVLDFLPELRPGWWVLRGYLVAVGVDALFFRPNASDGLPWPSVGGSSLFGLFFIGLCVWVSVLVGRMSGQDERVRRGSVVANAAIAFMLLVAIPSLKIDSKPVSYEQEAGPAFSGFLQHGDGSMISNICAYDSKGKLLKKVELYDQDGRPIDDVVGDGLLRRKLLGEAAAAGDGSLQRKLLGRIGVEDGTASANVYPRKQTQVDPRTGQLGDFACPKHAADNTDPGSRVLIVPKPVPVPFG